MLLQMKVLSFDVGIRNLAYCLFDIPESYMNNENNNIKNDNINELLKNIHIIDWDIINLVDDEKHLLCNSKNKNGKDCKNKAHYKKNNEYYCKKHAMNCKYIIPSKTNKISFIKKHKKGELIQYCKNHFITHEKDKNKEYYLSLVKKYMELNLMDTITSKKADSISLVTLGRTIEQKFNLLFKNYKIDLLLIENQISPIANRMKTIQGMITQYFIMNNVENIEFISSSNKLKLFTNKKTTYDERKKMGIETMNTQILHIVDNGYWKDLFIKHKKKDDLADAFLQCLYYLQK